MISGTWGAGAGLLLGRRGEKKVEEIAGLASAVAAHPLYSMHSCPHLDITTLLHLDGARAGMLDSARGRVKWTNELNLIDGEDGLNAKHLLITTIFR